MPASSLRTALLSTAALILAALPASAQQTIEDANRLPAISIEPPTPSRAATARRETRSDVRAPARRSQTRPQRATVARPGEAPQADLASQNGSVPGVSVSATSNATPTAQIGSSVTILTAADIEREQRRTVPDALQQVMGLNVVQSGGPGGQTSVFTRGTNSNHTKVLIDGIEVSDPSNPNRSFDLGQLLTQDIAQIEVLRGPQSGLYGADAIGGVISILTKKGEGPPKIAVTAEGGSHGTFNQFGTLSGSHGGFNYLFSIGHYRSEHTPVTPRDLVPYGRRINPNFYDNLSLSTKLGYDFNEYFSLNYTGRLINSRLLYTGDGGWPSFPNGFRSTQDDLFHFHRGEAVINLLDGRFRNVFGVGYANLDTKNQQPATAFGRPDPTTNIGIRTKYDYRGEFQVIDGQTLVFGVERSDESLNTKTLRAENGNTGAYLQLQSQFTDRIFLTSNVRYDSNDQFGESWTYRVAPVFIVPGAETKLKASVGTGFKAPTLSQLYQSYPAFGFFGNPNLKPEESFGWDVGFEQPLFNDRVRFGVTYFDNDIKNLIQSRSANFISTNVNVGRASTHGFETFATFIVSDALQFQLTYTNTIAKDEIARQELLRRPRHKGGVSATWKPIDKLTLSGTVIVVGSQVDGNRDFSIPRLRTAPYALVNAAANYQLTDQVNVFGRLDNLFNARVEDPTGYLRPGFAAYGGIRVTN
ncbi:TonB-dependent receptor plug domain-containing protein [Enterovirga rhinocerotis]|uniref:Vitamin B12 transporter n=1 Tax=Enterovirga rhinocerotis TaxID=1339210 RepID=A0A4R7BYN2_9HYPH|nr:TonB-dependent receptor [Enterovirga rhinocerotis]TDR89297.1 vitamin B12 transporter [Enterovirga rhinocerotis]